MNSEIKFIVKNIIIVFAAIIATPFYQSSCHAAEYSAVAPEIHIAQVLYQNDDVSLIMTEDGNVWSYEGLSMDTYGQPYIIDKGNPTGFTLIDIDTMIGVCLSAEGNRDGCLITDNGEIADPFYNYISYHDIPGIKPGDVVETTTYTIKGTDDDIIYRGDVVLHNIYSHKGN